MPIHPAIHTGAGAGPNLPQQQRFLPIHVAAQHGDAAMTGLPGAVRQWLARLLDGTEA